MQQYKFYCVSVLLIQSYFFTILLAFCIIEWLFYRDEVAEELEINSKTMGDLEAMNTANEKLKAASESGLLSLEYTQVKYVCWCLHLSEHLVLSVSLCMSLCFSLSIYLSISLPLHISPFLLLSLSRSLSLSLSMFNYIMSNSISRKHNDDIR